MSKQTIRRWCGYSRQAHHQAIQANKQNAIDAEVVCQIALEARRVAGKRLGTGKVYSEAKARLRQAGIKCGRDKFYTIMGAANLLIRPKKRHVRTTDSSAWMRQFDDLRKGFTPSGPDQLWSADITYIPCEERRLYLSLITDEYSRMIMGWELHDSLATSGPSLALDRALNYE